MSTRGRFVTHINRRLHELGWTDAQLGEASGIAPSAVNRIKNGRREPRVKTAICLARALGSSVETLFDRGR